MTAKTWIFLLHLLCLPLMSAGQCFNETTGPGCAYECHCKDPQYSQGCNDTADCQNGCIDGWRGATCQQENIARGKYTTSSQLFANYNTPDKAVDGIRSQSYSGFHTAVNTPSAWWSVDLESVRDVQEVIIYFRTDVKVRRNGLRFYTSQRPLDVQTQLDWGSPCYTVLGAADGTDINDILSIPECSGKFRYLMIYTNTSNEARYGPILDFSEVEVYDCSRSTYGEDCSQFCQFCDSQGCDLTGVCTAGCVIGRFDARCSQLCDYCDSVGCNSSGSCVADCSPGKTPFPSCSKDCPPGMYGAGCTQSCDQRGCGSTQDSCDVRTGACTSGCRGDNFVNVDCTVCVPGQYGCSCDKSCASRHCLGDNTTCDSNTGACVDGCTDGWTPPDCVTRGFDGVFSRSESPSTNTITGVGVAVGVVVGAAVMLLVVGVTLLVLKRSGRFLWVGSESKSSTARPANTAAAHDYEIPTYQPGHIINDYDVIKSKDYENV